MVNPKLRKRLIDSIEFLRKMDFFKDYSNLSSEEILEKIFSGEIDYRPQWFAEEWTEEEWRKKREEGRTWGQLLKRSLEEHEESWMKASNLKVDLKLASFDTKRVFAEEPETFISYGICKILLKKLSRISRGVFNPTDVREEIVEWSGKPPLALEEVLRGMCHDAGRIFRMFFKFGGKDYLAEFYSDRDFLYLDPAVKKINELIKDTGYQYYRLYGPDEDITYAVFLSDEVEKLKKRHWHLSLL
ncbi:MAG: hypothetical protein QXO47_01400 [Thermoproteota archaeon]|nr:hypothetical protein [Candidatus Brockarchaeota archaeon]